MHKLGYLLAIFLIGCAKHPLSPTQAKTELNSRSQHASELSNVLRKFPSDAFVITADKVETEINSLGQPQFVVPFQVAWDDAYLEKLRKILEESAQTRYVKYCLSYGAQNNCPPTTYVEVTSAKWFGGIVVAGFSDKQMANMIISSLVETRPAILITARNKKGKVLYRGCHRWMELDHMSGNVIPKHSFVELNSTMITLNGQYKLRSQAIVDAAGMDLSNIGMFSVDMVIGKDCPVGR